MMVLLVAESEKRRGVYEESLRLSGAGVTVVASLREAVLTASEKAFNGVLIDMPVIIKGAQVAKQSVDDLMEGLPCAFLNLNGKNREIRLLGRGAAAKGSTTMEEFVDVCGQYTPRIIFSRVREHVYINALLDLSPDVLSPDRTTTIDISAGGCFLFSVRDDIQTGAAVWIRLVGLPYNEPIQGAVCWKREWGAANAIPGIGIRFENASDSFKEEITAALAMQKLFQR